MPTLYVHLTICCLGTLNSKFLIHMLLQPRRPINFPFLIAAILSIILTSFIHSFLLYLFQSLYFQKSAMDLLQSSFSNLETETYHPPSPSSFQNEEEEEEVKRNWLSLPGELMSLIIMKLGYVDILGSVQWVCSSWWKLSKLPHLFHSIHVEKVLTLFGRSIDHSLYSNWRVSWEMMREAIDRSRGYLVEFSVEGFSGGSLSYMSKKSSSLRCLRLVSCNDLSDIELIEVARKLPQLEKHEIIHCSQFSKDVIEAFGRFCPLLKSCRLNYVKYLSNYVFSGVLVAIAQNMPELRYLNLFGSSLTDDDLKAILDGCPHLESLDLRQCYGLNKFAGNWKGGCGNLKVVRFPEDPTDDFEYELQPYISFP